MANERKLVVVLGATGAQAREDKSINSDSVLTITRDSQKESAKALAALGAEIVTADFDDEDSIKEALKGANAIFGITNFWDKADYDLEISQGKLINKLASEIPELEHYIFSSLPDGRKLENGKFQNILPYNAKAVLRDDLASYPVLAAKTSELWVAYYYQNWIKYQAVFGPQRAKNGNWIFSLPIPASTKIPASSADDTGMVVDAILRGGQKFFTKTVTLSAGSNLTQQDFLDIWSNCTGQKAVFEEVSVKDHYERMSAIPLPDHLSICVTELAEALKHETDVLEADGLVIGREVLIIAA
ncbi:hypothetical protein BP6252_08206 [Coleophoma cylindrospora]|uniref:NmrA-like domain-containing protein n=1 Tax=Coleophoma cylindrospora TaxID=1849047 RepID=A0A3D8RC66_9HELO|nr:hypothetical protein BP6252_08206 [Coleophoma cylindrospora]